MSANGPPLVTLPDVQTRSGCCAASCGIAVAVKTERPDARIVSVQAKGAAAFPGSLAAGEPVALPTTSTMADGIAVAAPGRLTLVHVADLVAALLQQLALVLELHGPEYAREVLDGFAEAGFAARAE